MIERKFQIWQLIIRAIIASVSNVIKKSFLVDVFLTEQLHGVFVVLKKRLLRFIDKCHFQKHLFKDSSGKKTVLFGGHNKVVSFILVVDNVLQSYSKLIVECVEEVLLVHEGHAADLLHHGFGRRVIVDEVGRDGDGQLAPELLTREALKYREYSVFIQVSRFMKLSYIDY